MNKLPLFFLLTILTAFPECKKITKRITSEIAADINQFSFFAQLDLQRHKGEDVVEGVCGGTLIHPQWVLTAAHCFPKCVAAIISQKNVFVYVGGNHVLSPKAEIRWLVNIIKHPKYIRKCDAHKTIKNDIALCKLNREYELCGPGNKITLAKLPLGSCRRCKFGNVVGVGVLTFHKSSSLWVGSVVRYWQVETDDIGRNLSFAEFFSDDDKNFGRTQPGDAGGPFLCYWDANFDVAVQYGVVSITKLYDDAVMTIYEDVRRHLDFIKKYVPKIVQSENDEWQWRTQGNNPDKRNQ